MSAPLCLIPARGGSKGLRDKNLRTVAGLSLVGRAVLSAREFGRLAGLRDLAVVLDTDSDAIAEEGRRWGAQVPFLRPTDLAGDEVPTAVSALAALERLGRAGLEVEDVVLLQPTSPLRTGADVLACWREYDRSRVPSVVSLVREAYAPDLALRRGGDGVVHWLAGVEPPARRQESPDAFRPSGAVYVIAHDLLRRERRFILPGVTRGVVLPPERSVDVDTAEDLAEAEARLAAGASPSFSIGRRTIGQGHPCFVIAEAGVNHNGDVDLAHRLVDVAAGVGADAVKFQTFEPEQLVSPLARKAEYQVANTGTSESQLEMLRRLALPHGALAPLAAHAAERGVLFLSTPFDEASADLLEGLGMPAYKIPSGEVTNHPFVAHLARKGRPVLMSTGMSTLAEVAQAVQVVRECGDPPLALLHCVTSYPAATTDCNLRAIATMRAAFGVPVGWSDHTEGIRVSLAAVAAGATLLEKHFTLDRTLPGPDHRASLEPDELGELMAAVREIEAAMGDGVKRPAPAEAANAALVRRSLHASRALPAGHVLDAADLVALRPGTGLPPALRDRLVGRRLRVKVERGEMLAEGHLD
jgi:N-acetylneuraminate synthase/N,N'-diacetyllegionaminate synthase